MPCIVLQHGRACFLLHSQLSTTNHLRCGSHNSYPCESLSFASSPTGRLPRTLQRLRCVQFCYVSTCRTRLAANLGGPQGGAQTGRSPGGARGKLSHQLRNQNVAPLPSSAARPESSTLGGFQERYGEWYQSEITNIQSIMAVSNKQCPGHVRNQVAHISPIVVANAQHSTDTNYCAVHLRSTAKKVERSGPLAPIFRVPPPWGGTHKRT